MAEEKDQVLFHQDGIVAWLRQAPQEEILTFPQEETPVCPAELLPELNQFQQIPGEPFPLMSIISKLSIQQTEN